MINFFDESDFFNDIPVGGLYVSKWTQIKEIRHAPE